jgi:Holliday junction DNA helicase RuvA
MIYYIKGILSLIKSDAVIIDANGVGYHIYCPETTLQSLPDSGATLQLFTFHHIREDQQLLFGFQTEEERQFFMTLTSVSGIGPKLAIKILSSLSISQLTQALLQGDLVQLTSVSGVGKKMAERMIIDLKDKLAQLYDTHTIISATNSAFTPTSVNNDLILACKTLGYSQDEIKKGLAKAGALITNDHPLEENLKQLLKQF